MVSFFLGKGNLDISGRILKTIAELAEKADPKDKIFYIVPDQFESETEDAVYDILEKKDLGSREDVIDVTTFSLLAETLMSETKDVRPRADDIVKSVVMHQTVSKLKGQLQTLDRIAEKQGFNEKISDTVKGFKSLGISAKELEDKLALIEQNDELKNSAVFKKLSDVSMIYTWYDQAMNEDYIDSLDLIGLSADLIQGSELFDGADVFVDCFNDFTNDQLGFLFKLIEKAKNVTFGFVTDRDSESDVFFTANLQISRLEKYARDSNEDVEFITDGFSERYTDEALAEIPRKLYQENPSARVKTDSCELISAPDIFSELDFVCAKIKELVETRDIRYNNIAVLCPDLSGCGRYIESAFKKYDIPFFLDMRESILMQPLINAVLALLKTLKEFTLENVLSCIKTGFFTEFNEKDNERECIRDSHIGIFEDYVFEWALKTSHLTAPFTYTTLHDDDKQDHKLNTAENIRKSVAMPLYEFHQKLKKQKTINGAKLTEEIYDYLIKTVDIRRAIRAKTNQDADSAPTYQRLWNTLINILNALHKILEDEDVTIGEYCDIFRDICMSATLAAPPDLVDTVLAGNIDRTRAANIKAAFIIEASYNSFPAPAANVGIFSQYETDIIHDFLSGVEGTNADGDVYLRSSSEQYKLALYRAYRAVCLPTEYLCVSCAETSASGDPAQSSPVSDEIEGLFSSADGGSIRKNTSDFGNEFYCRSLNSAKLRFALGINSASRENEVLKRAIAEFGSDPSGFTERLTKLRDEKENPTEETVKHTISPDTAALLFPTDRGFGATIIEKIAKCKFKYFCEYGLSVKERTQRIFTIPMRGNAVHYVLEKVLNDFSGDIRRFCELERGELYALALKYIDEYCRLETNYAPVNDGRDRFLFSSTANAATDTLVSMQMEFSSSKFRPKFFELNLKAPSSLNILDNETPFTHEKYDTPFYAAPMPIPNTPPVSYLPGIKLNAAPLPLKLANGTTVKIIGKIDRVDMFSENGKTYIRVVDYKSSAHCFDVTAAEYGANIQMLIYLSALLEANKQGNFTAGGISYVPVSRVSTVDDDLQSPNALIALKHFPSGLLVADSVTAENYKGYQEYVGGYLTDEEKQQKLPKALLDMSILSGASKEKSNKNIIVADEKEFDEIRKKVTDGITSRFAEIYDGNVDAIPLSYKEQSAEGSTVRCECDYCRFKNICKNNGKIIRDVEEIKKSVKETEKAEEAESNSEERSE